ncbi:protein disulfide-isomerase A5 [Sergentomyia squamirostris]
MKGYLVFSLLLLSTLSTGKINSKSSSVLDDIVDIKDFKKLLRTKNNVLVLFVSSTKENQANIRVFREAADAVKGEGTLALLDCSNSEVKKICKKLKVNPEVFIIKHYKDGEFNRDYDRRLAVPSFVNFMRDPVGDLPWEEDPVGVDVVHVPDAQTLDRFLKKETKPILLMFYAPWCGYCKTLKPEYSAAATEIKDKYILAAIDVNRPENSVIRKLYNITGFPTLLYYEGGRMKHTYEGDNNKAGIIAFMENPTTKKTAPKVAEPDWASETTSEIVHLTATSFEPALKEEKSVMVMFYAPWCGHCKRMKPEYEKAAQTMKEEDIPGMLAAVDATREGAVALQYNINGYPTVKFFEYGEFKFDVNVRKADEIVKFMKDPKEPPPPPPPEPSWEDIPSEVIHLTDETFKTVLKKKKNVLVMFYAPWCGHCKAAKPEFVKAAEQFKDDAKYELAAVDCTKQKETCSYYGVKGYPTIKYFSYLKTVKDYNGGRVEKDFVAFLKGGGEVEEPPKQSPEEVFGDYPGAEHLIHMSEGNFDDFIKKHKKLFVFFYAPWCGHCKVVKSTIAEIAEDFSRMENDVKIGVIDASENSKIAKRFSIDGFPKFKMFIDGQVAGTFQGERSRSGFKEFIMNDGQSTKDEL